MGCSPLFDWTFEPGRVARGWQISGTHPMAGLAGRSDRPTTVAMWTVANVESAVQRVRQARGHVISEPAPQSYGLTAECTDDRAAGSTSASPSPRVPLSPAGSQFSSDCPGKQVLRAFQRD